MLFQCIAAFEYQQRFRPMDCWRLSAVNVDTLANITMNREDKSVGYSEYVLSVERYVSDFCRCNIY